MKKKSLVILFSILFLLTVILVIIGFLFNKTEVEKQNGLSNQYDISSQNVIAYVNYTDGKPELHLYDSNEETMRDAVVVEYDENTMILDPTFSKDGSTLAYVTTNKDKESELTSTVYFLDMETEKERSIFTDHSTITEIEFKPDNSSLLYLRAGTYENYSPITGKRPHDFDVYEYNLEKKTHLQKTHLQQYSIHSLRVSPKGDSVYLQRDDDSSVTTAEDSFQVKLRIFEIPLENPNEMRVISDPTREVDVFSFDITPNEEEMIFQTISNHDEGGTYKYELYKYSFHSKKEKQLTYFGKHASDPIITDDGQTVYFMLDSNFAHGDPVYHLYKMSIGGDSITEIELP